MAYLTKTEQIRIGSTNYQMRSLLNSNQFSDELPTTDVTNEGQDSNIGINRTNWPLFGLIWPAGLILAEIIDQMDLAGLRIMEVGCGLAMAGIVAHRKGADVIVSDFHPNASEFLAHNLSLNGLPPMRYVEANWSETYPDLGMFDLIIGSDVLYDRDHPRLLSNFIVRHLKPTSRVIITDPGRQNYRQFTKDMQAHGFSCESTMKKLSVIPGETAQCRVLDYRRG